MTATAEKHPAQDLASLYGDQWTRLNSLYYIMDTAGKEVQFRPNPAQAQLYRDMWYLTVILKARQHGISSFIELWILDQCLFNSNLRAAIIADNRENAEHLFEDKIRFAYERLPRPIRDRIPARNDRVGELQFGNNSQIRVTTSARSGTHQILHVSEYGKIAFENPRKAREIKTGSFESVHAGQMIFVESTAKGYRGYFHDLVEQAKQRQEDGRSLNKLEFRLHFIPWFKHPEYFLPKDEADQVVIGPQWDDYFATIEGRYNTTLSRERRAWYVTKWRTLEEDMWSEHPSTPEEAFQQPVEGAYYARQMAEAQKEGRITNVPYDPRLPVHTAWDLGHNDKNAIWFFQVKGMNYFFIRYFENHGEPIQYYAQRLIEYGYIYGTCYLPHDANNVDYTRADQKSRAQILEDLGFKVEVVPRVEDINEAIQASRDVIPACSFDAELCEQGVAGLRSYRREWDDNLEEWKAKPRHDWASHPADAFATFARGFDEGAPPGRIKRDRRNWRTV